MQKHFKDRATWRRWLTKNHDESRELWMMFYKKHVDKAGIDYDAAVEEALCFGWIDSLIKRLDDDRYLRKFTPRTNTAKWSASNLKRIERMIAEGKMTDAGSAKIPDSVQALPAIATRSLDVPAPLAQALADHPAAQRFFDGLAPSYRRNFIHWIGEAKREQTRQRRVAEAVEMLSQGRKLGMK
jgi:uncharacterized protein YdeI (YjbR/CyaY-like superfamily)